MGVEKQGSKGGGYVGGFFQLFDWNAKSRKKLFSNKSDLQGTLYSMCIDQIFEISVILLFSYLICVHIKLLYICLVLLVLLVMDCLPSVTFL